MTDDLLERATRALREESNDGDAGARFTRARVMAGLQQSTTRRHLKLAFVLPIAACFAAATAFGMVDPRPRQLIEHVAQVLGLSEPRASSSKPVTRTSPVKVPAKPAPVERTRAPEPADSRVTPAEPPLAEPPLVQPKAEPPQSAAQQRATEHARARCYRERASSVANRVRSRSQPTE